MAQTEPSPFEEPFPLSGSKAFCVAASPMVRAMYKEGVGLGALWYSGHFDTDSGY